jgi:fibro-slime domain-containing protein
MDNTTTPQPEHKNYPHQEAYRQPRPPKHKKSRTIFSTVFKVIAIVSFCVLAFISVANITKAIATEDLNNERGIPAQWVNLDRVASDTSPTDITIPATYFDQRSDHPRVNNSDVGRQFEWSRYGSYAYGLQQGLVKDYLGSDGLPVPAYASTDATKAAGLPIVDQGVVGSIPLKPTDNFYRWFHEVEGKSKKIQKSLKFTKIASETYQYGDASKSIFPLDSDATAQDFSSGDYSSQGHNFYFTMHMNAPFIVKADGTEEFSFVGDDDVWVYLNGKLVLDIGGVHEKISGSFKINKESNGSISVTSTVAGKTKTITDIGLVKGDVATISFFYAERNTTVANCLITMKSMRIPVPATPRLSAFLNTDRKMVEYTSTLRNNDVSYDLEVKGIASWINDGHAYAADKNVSGFLPLSSQTAYYSFTPDVASSWKPLQINRPTNASDGFAVVEPNGLILGPADSPTGTVYLKYEVEPESANGELFNSIVYNNVIRMPKSVNLSNLSPTASKQPSLFSSLLPFSNRAYAADYIEVPHVVTASDIVEYAALELEPEEEEEPEITEPEETDPGTEEPENCIGGSGLTNCSPVDEEEEEDPGTPTNPEDETDCIDAETDCIVADPEPGEGETTEDEPEDNPSTTITTETGPEDITPVPVTDATTTTVRGPIGDILAPQTGAGRISAVVLSKWVTLAVLATFAVSFFLWWVLKVQPSLDDNDDFEE